MASNRVANRMVAYPLRICDPDGEGGLCAQEGSYPTRHARAVVRRVERSDGTIGVGQNVASALDQGAGEIRAELRMELERDGAAIGPGQRRKRREVRRRHDFRVRWLSDDLILMRSRDGDFAHRVQPAFVVNDP